MCQRKRKGGRSSRSDRELKERVEGAARLLSSGRRKGEVKALLKARYGVSARTCEAYITAARKRLMEERGTNREEQRMLSFAFWVEVIRDPASSVRDMMFARHNLDILLGLVPKRRFRLRPSLRTSP
jgi:hypothetical protein